MRVDTVPALDCSRVFPDLERGAGVGGGSRAGSGFAQELARRMTSQPGSGEVAAPHPSAVIVAGRFVGELPDAASGSWRKLADGDVTLLAHVSDAGLLDALVYAEAFSPLVAARPSEELARFALTVDPGLLDAQLTSPAAATTWVEALARSRRERPALRRLAWMAMSRTGGRGFGYASSPRTFTGWKWMGRSRDGVFLRLARSQGEWSGQKPLDPELQALLPRVVQRFPRLGWLAPTTAAGPYAASIGGRAAVPAYMVLGTASTAETGSHLAVLCAQTPTCAPAGELADFLASLRPAKSADVERLLGSPDGTTLEGFAAELGFVVAPSGERSEPGTPPS